MGYSLWVHKELDMTERLHLSIFTAYQNLPGMKTGIAVLYCILLLIL